MHITFARLQYLWLIAAALPGALGIWAWLLRRQRKAREAFTPVAHQMYGEANRAIRSIGLMVCDVVLLALPILALAHPQRMVIAMEPVYTRALTVVAFDNSSSTKSEAGYFGEGGRFGAEKRAFLALLDAPEPLPTGGGLRRWLAYFFGNSSGKRLMEGQRIAIVRFAGLAITTQEPTARHESVREVIRLLEPVADPNDDGTYFAGALEESLLIFNSDTQASVRVLIVLTDGEKDEGKERPIDPALEKLVAGGVKIFPIVVGHECAPIPSQKASYNEEGSASPVYEFTQPDTELPQYFAEKSGGKMFKFDEREKLYGILAEIFATVRDAVTEPVEKRENLQSWCAIGFLVMWFFRILAQYLIPEQRSES